MVKKKTDLYEKDIFTTYDAARICNANIASIKNWIAKGLLKAFRTPGGHYRIKRRDLQLFIQKYNMPNPFQERYEKKVYILDADPGTLDKLSKALADHTVTTFDDPLPAALKIGLERPDLLVMALDIGDVRAEDFVDLLSGYPETKNVAIAIFSDEGDQARSMGLRKKGVADVISKDTPAKDLKQALADIIEG